MSTFEQKSTAYLQPDAPEYPQGLRHHLVSPPALAWYGNPALLDRPRLALFGSNQCPARLILQMHDLAQALRQSGAAVIGGFHTPVEQEALTVLLRGQSPLVICPARSLARMRIPKAWRSRLEEGRLLVLSPFTGSQHRVTARLAAARNRLVAALAAQVFIAHAAPGSKTEQLGREAMGWGQPVYTFDHPANARLIGIGAAAVKDLDGLMDFDDQNW